MTKGWYSVEWWFRVGCGDRLSGKVKLNEEHDVIESNMDSKIEDLTCPNCGNNRLALGPVTPKEVDNE